MRILLLLAISASTAIAQGAVAGGAGPKAGISLSTPMQIAVFMTLMALLPAAVMSITPFLRITIVLHFLRQALGTQSTPSNQILVGLGLFLSMLVMRPVATEIYQKGWLPVEKGEMSLSDGFEAGSKPMKVFLSRFTREKDVQTFLEIARAPRPRSPEDLDLTVLIPSYILSELKAGFQIGAVLFLPFLIIDLVVAAVTLSIGMVQLPPVMISAPFKILLFVLVDGWSLVIGSLMKSLYQT